MIVAFAVIGFSVTVGVIVHGIAWLCENITFKHKP